MEKQYIEISLDKDKRDVAAILVMNGYNVAIETVKTDKGRGRKMLVYWREEKKCEDK